MHSSVHAATVLRRTTLATPAGNERMVVKAAASAADTVFLDLEDAVAPSRKDSARSAAAEALRGLDWRGKVRAVRINAVDTPWCHRDVITMMEAAGDVLDLLIIPKVTCSQDIWFVNTLLQQLESGLGLPPGKVGIEVLIEQAAALAQVERLARCCRRITSLVLGTADLGASLRMPPDPEDPAATWRYPRMRLAAAAHGAGRLPVDGPYGALGDDDGCRSAARAARSVGMVGKWVIHPDQIAPVNDAFTPTDDEIEQARHVVSALDTAIASGVGAIRHNGVVIDAANGQSYRDLLITAAEIRRRTSAG